MKKYNIHLVMRDYQRNLGEDEKVFEPVGIADPLSELFKENMVVPEDERRISHFIQKEPTSQPNFRDVLDNFFDSPYDED